jgi:hypothetical protein
MAHYLILQPHWRAMAAFITASKKGFFVIVAHLTFLWLPSAIIRAVALERIQEINRQTPFNRLRSPGEHRQLIGRALLTG